MPFADRTGTFASQSWRRRFSYEVPQYKIGPPHVKRSSPCEFVPCLPDAGPSHPVHMTAIVRLNHDCGSLAVNCAVVPLHLTATRDSAR